MKQWWKELDMYTKDLIATSVIGIILLLLFFATSSCGYKEKEINPFECPGGSGTIVTQVVDRCSGEPIDVDLFSVRPDGSREAVILNRSLGAPIGQYGMNCVDFSTVYEITIKKDGYPDLVGDYYPDPIIPVEVVEYAPDGNCEDPADLTPYELLQECISTAVASGMDQWLATSDCCASLKGEPYIDAACNQ